MNIANYYLDLEKVSKIESKHDRDIIHNYYRDLMYCLHDGREDMGKSMFATLENGGYLINIREKKIGDILDGD